MRLRSRFVSLLMLALLLLRTGAAPVMADCASSHHTPEAGTPAAAPLPHHVNHSAETDRSGCDGQGDHDQSDTLADCGMSAGCSPALFQVAMAGEADLAAEVLHAYTPFRLEAQPRAVRPASPPPKS